MLHIGFNRYTDSETPLFNTSVKVTGNRSSIDTDKEKPLSKVRTVLVRKPARNAAQIIGKSASEKSLLQQGNRLMMSKQIIADEDGNIMNRSILGTD